MCAALYMSVTTPPSSSLQYHIIIDQWLSSLDAAVLLCRAQHQARVLWSCLSVGCCSILLAARCNRCFTLWWSGNGPLSNLYPFLTILPHSAPAKSPPIEPLPPPPSTAGLASSCPLQMLLNHVILKVMFAQNCCLIIGSDCHCTGLFSHTKFMLKCWSHFQCKLGLNNNRYFSSPPTAAAFLFH